MGQYKKRSLINDGAGGTGNACYCPNTTVLGEASPPGLGDSKGV